MNFITNATYGTGGGIAFNAQIAGSTVGGVFVPGPDTNAVHDIPFVNDVPGSNRQTKFSTAVRVEHDFDFATLESVSSYNYIDDQYQAQGLPYADQSNPLNDFVVDGVDFGAAFGDTTQKWQNRNKAFIQELRLTSSDDAARIRWQVGAYFQEGTLRRVNLNGINTGGGIVNSLFPSGPGSTNPTLNYDRSRFGVTNFSPFGNVQVDITDDLQLTLAGRYEIERRNVRTLTEDIPNLVAGLPTYNQCVINTGRAASDCNDAQTFKQFQPKVTLAYTLPDELGSVYASWGQGFKSGGFNLIGSRDILVAAAEGIGADASSVFVTDAFAKETTNAYELGFKLRFWDQRVSFNGAIFRTDVDDAQQFEFFPVGNIQAVSRIDKQRIEGIEFDIQVTPTDWLNLFAAVGITDAKIRRLEAAPAFEGNRVPYIENHNVVVGYQVNYPINNSDLEFVQRTEYKRFGNVWYDASNLAGSRRDPVDLIDARIGVSSEFWDATLWVRNLTNEKYASESVPLLAFLNVPYRAPTRSYGIEARVRF